MKAFKYSVLLILLCGCVLSRPYRITVVDPEGVPVRDAKVTITSLNMGGGGFTDPAGVFVTRYPVERPDYIRVSKDGFQTFTAGEVSETMKIVLTKENAHPADAPNRRPAQQFQEFGVVPMPGSQPVPVPGGGR